MTVFEIWSKNVRSRPSRAERCLPAALLALLLTGCGGEGTAPEASQPPPGPAPASPAAAAQPPVLTGLTPLPTPNQVLASIPSGRDDPFAPMAPSVSATPGSQPAPVRLSLPPSFRFTGVISSAGRSKAIVDYGATSGALSVGDRGGSSTDLLPPGWTVAAINADRGLLTLRQGRQTVSAEL
ncbi:hypothetical protein [Cyanobium sp. LEGE 06113]|uniref:hypothetical protein n=1 Tax=Cyanobium sp. LEGE 06113 TaxID=1297573 RepID=UPI00187EC645|nr:hypothetical protein [Cyanobium sp. LEGE 06113]MBE9154570.1 hypothetical protein [Cyanobium sp. LEGE 06113]